MMKYFFVALVIFSLSSCSSYQQVRGNILKPYQLDALILNESTRQDVIKHLGSPTTVTSFNHNTWYYIGQRRERVAFLSPDIEQHDVYELVFDNDILVNIKHFNQDDMHHVDFSDDTTKTVGIEESVMQQLLGNVGRFNKQPAGVAGQ